MKTVLFFARDPGGANVILPVYKKIRNQFKTLIYAKDFALKRIEAAEDVPVIDIMQTCVTTEYKQIFDFLKTINPDAIVTGTSLDDYTERYLWKASEELHIKSFAILDQWMNLGIRFSKYTYEQAEQYEACHRHSYLPYRICVMDELAKAVLVENGIDEIRIAVTGQPHFENIYSKYQQANHCYDTDYINIVFVSEPILQDYDKDDKKKSYWGYNEKTIFYQIYNCLKTIAGSVSKSIKIIVRPHPRENVDAWLEITAPLECANIKIEIDEKNDSFSILKSADIVCGMSSMFLLEAVICEKPILSIEIGLCRENPFVLDKIGICKSILTEEELSLKLPRLIGNLQRNELIKTVNFEFKKGAVENIISAIEKEVEK